MNLAKIKRRNRLLILLLAFVAFSISGILILNASRDSLIFFYSPSEIINKKEIEGKTIRLGGLVEKGTINYIDKSKLQFKVTDGNNYILVLYEGIVPDLFREEQGVVCEGKVNLDGIFVADRILAKHDENYMPPEVADKLKESGKWKGEN